ncbi:MAG: isochorismatase family protein [Myxococcota bacterium]
MTATTSALVLLDYQENLVALAQTQRPDRVRAMATATAGVAAAVGLPAFASVVPFGTDAPELLPGTKHLPELVTVARNTVEPFGHAASAEAIAGLDRKHLVFAGVFSEIIVVHGARAAIAAGYGVTILTDGCAGFGDTAERYALEAAREAGAELSSVATWASSLVPAWDSELGGRISEAILPALVPQP